jgi:TPP-dependent pyruvate/acetoin dehydrogenase alpha subunit
MLDEGKAVVTPVESGEPSDRPGLKRRAFLAGLGGVAAGVAVISRMKAAHADSVWNEGVLDDMSNEQLVDMLTKMYRSRWWEEGIKEQFLAGTDGLYGSFHIAVGQEACPVGACAALRDDDFITSTHRGHHDLIAKGGDIRKMAAEIYFKETGYNKAYGGSMHITDLSLGILGMNGIIGPSHLLAAGAAYGNQIRGTDQVALSFGGDGSVNNGYFWAGLRNAALYKLPLIMFIQNNGWQVSNPVQNTTPLKDLAVMSKGLEIPGYVVDGNDVLAVYSVTKAAVDRARRGEGPTLIEAKTNRFYDHSGLAGASAGVLGAFGLPYRSDKDVRAWIANDPILRFRNVLAALEVLTPEQADELEAEVRAQVDEAIEFARSSPLPNPELGLENVYAQGRVLASQFA